MAAKIIAPKLGMGLKPLSLIEWQAKEGDRVEKGTVVLVVETDKIRHDIEAETSGFLHILVNAGNEVPVGSVAGLIAETKEELEALQKEVPEEVPTATVEAKEAPKVEAIAPAVGRAEDERIRISPAARKMAEDHMIDITQVVGGGPGGRIVREDIEKAIETKKAGVAPIADSEVYQGKTAKSTIPLMGTRKTIAEHMHRSLSITAHVTAMGEIDMTEMVKLRKILLAQEETLGTRITYTDLLVSAVARVLRDYPMINASVLGNEIKLWEDINIAVAVSVEGGLIVPVVKNADQKSLVEISQEVKRLAKKARERTLTSEEVKGGTLTLTNLGAMAGGYRFETVIINQPETAILGTGSITDRVVAREGQVVIKPIMTYYFTYDHRVIDGVVAAQFIASLTKLLETPALLSA